MTLRNFRRMLLILLATVPIASVSFAAKAGLSADGITSSMPGVDPTNTPRGGGTPSASIG